MTDADLAYLPLVETAAALRAGALDPRTLVDCLLARIGRHDPALRAFITVDCAGARAAADALGPRLAAGEPVGPLAGVPYALKDIFETRGLRTTAGSRVLSNWVPKQDAAVVSRLTTADAVLLGKTNLHEFCHGATGENEHFGTARNPWDTGRLAGGSSSGSAAAVAAGLVPASFGSDAGGSVRVPAALCGIVGLKPTYGLISCHGAVPYCWSLDHVGILTRTVADAAAVLEVAAGYDARDPASADIGVPAYGACLGDTIAGLRIGVPRTYFFEHVDPEIEAAAREAIGSWEAAGAVVAAVEMPALEDARTVSLIIQMAELLSYHARYLPERAHLYGTDIRAGFATGQFLLAEHYVRAKRFVESYRRAMDRVFETADVVASPTCPLVAPVVGTERVTVAGLEEVLGNALTRFTGFFNMTGHPALSVPTGLHSTGLPMAVQIVCRHFEETTLLRLGHAYETHRGRLPRPPGFG